MTSPERERAVAFVVARLDSSRFPAKQFRLVGARSILDRIFDSLNKCGELDLAVLATVAEPANERLRDFANNREIPLFWYEGDPDHVTTRLARAGEAFHASICLLISADCPLIDPASVDALIRRMREVPEADYLTTPPLAPDRSLLLEGVQVARLKAWVRADALSDRPELKEHQFPVIYRSPGLFVKAEATLDEAVYGPHHRMSVDTWADLEFMETLHTRLTAADLPFDLPHAVGLMNGDPSVGEINAHVHQRKLLEDIRKVLIIADAGGPYGYGHFMRCRELAGQLVERASWPVTFLVDDEAAARMALDCGFHTLWGALGRTAAPPPDGVEVVSPGKAAVGHGLVLADISAQRSPPPGWEKQFPPGMPLVAMDREDDFANGADLIIIPGITGRAGTRSGGPRIVGGSDRAILRREVRRYKPLSFNKELDILAYLHLPEQRLALEKVSEINGWNTIILSGFVEDFPKLLAKARIFLSGYGISFYEALHLNALPVAWPLSPLHRADAEGFYRAYDLTPLCVSDSQGLSDVLAPLLAGPMPKFMDIVDGTPSLVEELVALARNKGL